MDIVKNLDGIVVNLVDYKDNDVIATFLTKQYGFIQVYVKGRKKISSKSYYLINEFNEIKFDLSKLNLSGLSTFKSGTSTTMLDYTNLSVEASACLMLMGELLNKIKSNNEFNHDAFYKHTKHTIHELSSDNHLYEALNKFIYQVLKINGITLVIDRCVSCANNSSIVGFDINNHGFICSDCLHENTESIISDRKVLETIYLLDSDTYKASGSSVDKTVFKLLYYYLKEDLGIYLKSGQYLY